MHFILSRFRQNLLLQFEDRGFTMGKTQRMAARRVSSSFSSRRKRRSVWCSQYWIFVHSNQYDVNVFGSREKRFQLAFPPRNISFYFSAESTTTNASSSFTVRPRYKMDDASLIPRSQPKDHSSFSSTSLPKSNTSSALQQHNGHFHSGTSSHTQNESFQSTEPMMTTSSNRLPSPGDDSSRMSFSSTSSKESVAGGTGSNRTTSNHTGHASNGAMLYASLSEPGSNSSNLWIDRIFLFLQLFQFLLQHPICLSEVSTSILILWTVNTSLLLFIVPKKQRLHPFRFNNEESDGTIHNANGVRPC